MKKKRSQVTAFIIMSLVILFGLGMLLFIRQRSEVFSPSEIIPPEVAPINEYVENCIESKARDALALIGMQGGYLEYPEELKTSFTSLMLAPEAGIGIPYWYYSGENRHPSLQRMQTDAENYLEATIGECINSFRDFEHEFEITPEAGPEFEVTIAENSVVVNLEYPLSVKVKGEPATIRLERFRKELNIRLKKLYDLSVAILYRENEEVFLENITLDLIFLNPNIPVTGVELRCTPLLKSIADIRSNIKEMLAYNIADVRLKNTKYSEFAEGDKTYARGNLLWDAEIDRTAYKDISVLFSYERDYPLRLFISPNDGRYIRAEPVKLIDFLPTCLLQYHFTYDLVYPVRVTLMDDEGPEHEAYIFQFAMPVMINHNQADKLSEPRSSSDTRTPIYDAGFCNNYQTKPVRITAENSISHEELVHVNITARCVNYVCPLGEIIPRRGQYYLAADVPDCKLVEITGKKEGYVDGVLYLDLDEESEAIIQMLPLKRMAFEVVKHSTDYISWELDLEDDEVASVALKSRDYDYSTEATFPMQEGAYIDLLDNYDQRYVLEILLIKNATLTGGYSINWTVSWDKMMYGSSLKFHVYQDKSSLGDEEKEYGIYDNLRELSKRVPLPEIE